MSATRIVPVMVTPWMEIRTSPGRVHCDVLDCANEPRYTRTLIVDELTFGQCACAEHRGPD
jgi:hypothetical protein